MDSAEKELKIALAERDQALRDFDHATKALVDFRVQVERANAEREQLNAATRAQKNRVKEAKMLAKERVMRMMEKMVEKANGRKMAEKGRRKIKPTEEKAKGVSRTTKPRTDTKTGSKGGR